MPTFFAYGSLACPDKIMSLCGLTKAPNPLAIAGAPGQRLVFRSGGVEDIEPDPSCSTWGVLYDINDQDIQKILQVSLLGTYSLFGITIPVTARTPDGNSVSRVGAAPIEDGQEVQVLTCQIARPAGAAVVATDEEIRPTILAALRVNLPLRFIKALQQIYSRQFCVEDVVPGQNDNTGQVITKVYTKSDFFYAIYATEGNSVLIQYADDMVIAERQRIKLAQLSSIRGRIYGLMGTWRTPGALRIWLEATFPSVFLNTRQKMIDDYNVRIASVLAEALMGSDRAATEIQEVHDDLLSKITSGARLGYVLWSSVVSIIFAEIFLLMRHYKWPFDQDKQFLWLAAAGGVVGAFFSIATGIRGRSVTISVSKWDNRVDGALRVAVGAIAAGTLLLILLTKFIADAGIGSKGFGDAMTWQVVSLIGFAAGFTERMVPDLLARGTPSPAAPK